jgi:hypothetical protein
VPLKFIVIILFTWPSSSTGAGMELEEKNRDFFFVTNQYYSPFNAVSADFNPESIVQWDKVIFRY